MSQIVPRDRPRLYCRLWDEWSLSAERCILSVRILRDKTYILLRVSIWHLTLDLGVERRVS